LSQRANIHEQQVLSQQRQTGTNKASITNTASRQSRQAGIITANYQPRQTGINKASRHYHSKQALSQQAGIITASRNHDKQALSQQAGIGTASRH
jgi:hypothetical protein